MGRRLPKPAAFIEPLCSRRESVRKNAADADDRRGLASAQSRGDRDRARGEAVIPGDTISTADDIAPRGAARLVRPRPPAQPVIESGLAAGKGGKIVSVAEQLRCREFGKGRYSQGALVCISLRSCSFGRGGASSSAMKRA